MQKMECRMNEKISELTEQYEQRIANLITEMQEKNLGKQKN